MAQSLTQQLDQLVPANLDHQALLRGVFGVHFALVSIVLLGSWPPTAYVFYNSFFFAALLWAIKASTADSELPLLKCFLIDAGAILFDILCMIGHYNSSAWAGLSLAACLLNLLARPATAFLLFRVRNERLRSRYDNWDESAQQSGAASGGGGGATPYSMGGYEVPPSSFGADNDTKPIAP